MVKIEKIKKEELHRLAEIYEKIYRNIPMGEDWSIENSYQMMQYFYTVQSDLFLCAYIDDKPIGAIMSIIKPYWNGINLSDTEIYVDPDYQGLQIGKNLMKEHFKLAIDLYGASHMNAHTYTSENNYPLKWYKKLGYEVSNSLVVISGDLKKILPQLDS